MYTFNIRNLFNLYLYALFVLTICYIVRRWSIYVQYNRLKIYTLSVNTNNAYKYKLNKLRMLNVYISSVLCNIYM